MALNESVITVTIDYHDGASVKTAYFCRTRDVEFVTRPTDTPASTPFVPRLLDAGIYNVSAVAPGATRGESASSAGVISFDNSDGGLDGWASYGVGDRAITVRAHARGAAYPAGSVVLLAGRVAATPVPQRDKMQVYITDRDAELRKPLLQTFYAGNNALPAGIEGRATDLKGKAKPKHYGVVRRVEPKQVNTSRLIWHFSIANGTVLSLSDGGSPLAAGAAYSSQSDMEANAPTSPDDYRVWAGAGGIYVRMRASPVKALLGDVQAAGSASDWTCAQILKQMAIDMGIASGDVDAGDVTALDAAASAVLGYYADGNVEAKSAMSDVADSVGAWFYTDGANKLRMGQLQAPSGTSAAALSLEVISIDRVLPSDRENGSPVWRVEIEWGRTWKRLSNGELALITGTFTEAMRAELVEEYRVAAAEDASIKTKHADARVLRIRTLIDVQSAAEAEAARQLAMRKVERTTLRVTARPDAAQLAAMLPGLCVTITHPRHGCAAGKQLRILSRNTKLASGEVEMILWG